jgi:CDP-glycerol glycerophosphotransferase
LSAVLEPPASLVAQQFEDRLQALEAFDREAGEALSQVVDAVVELRQGLGRLQEIESLKVRLRELEQQLSLERAGRDLAQVSHMHAKSRHVVFVGTTYFGCNVKYAWAEAHRRGAEALGFEAWFLPYNAEQEQLVSGLGGRCLPAGHQNWQPEHIQLALSAALVVTSDHFLNPNPYAAALLAGARQVQLWHGVSIKEIGLRNLAGGRALGPHFARVLATCGRYARFVGTAQHAEAEWRRWFAFERYCGTRLRAQRRAAPPARRDRPGRLRPRDLRPRRETLARGKRVLLYAPTFRDGRPEWVLQAGLDKLAQAAAQGGDLLVVNLHPVESPQIPKLAPLLPGVAFVRPRTDLYPLLAQASALVTDYSSVMFDYLQLDRPVLLYRPDHAAYTAARASCSTTSSRHCPARCSTTPRRWPRPCGGRPGADRRPRAGPAAAARPVVRPPRRRQRRAAGGAAAARAAAGRRGVMSPPGRPKGSYRSAQHEGTPMSAPGRSQALIPEPPGGEGFAMSPPGRPKGSYRSPLGAKDSQ